MKKTNSKILLLAAFNVLLHIFFYGKLEFHRDELLYFSMGLHPDVGYASVPPLTGWIATVMQAIFGPTLFAAKLFPAILGGVVVWLTAGIARALGGKDYAQVLAAIVVIFMPVTLRAFHLFQPVPTDLFFWTLLTYFSLRYINTEKDNYLYALGVTAGLAMLNKYLVALWLFGLLLGMVFTEHRKILVKKSFYLAFGIGFLIFLPNLIWQIQNDFMVASHMEALDAKQLTHMSRFTFLADQLMMSLGGILLMIPGLVFLMKNNKYRYLGVGVFVVFVVLLILKGKSYYSIGVFPLLIGSGAVFYENKLQNRFLKIALPVFLVIVMIPIIPLGLPVAKAPGLVTYFKKLEEKTGLTLGRRFEDGTIHDLPQDYADQIGWDELAQITAKAYDQIPDKEASMIFCDNYGQAGAVAIMGQKYGLPQPDSFSDSFFFWATPADELDKEIQHFIYINDEYGDFLDEYFNTIELVGQITNPYAREKGTMVYLASNPKQSFNAFWKRVVETRDERHIFGMD